MFTAEVEVADLGEGLQVEENDLILGKHHIEHLLFSIDESLLNGAELVQIQSLEADGLDFFVVFHLVFGDDREFSLSLHFVQHLASEQGPLLLYLPGVS